MKIKRFIAMCVTMVIMITSSGITAYAKKTQPIYQITDEYVVIDSVSYKINNNTIEYDGKIYEIINYSLVSYEPDGTKIIWVLPVDQNRITDPTLIAELNAQVAASKSNTTSNSFLSRAIPTDLVNAPYNGYVPQGQWYTKTPVVNIQSNGFKYNTNLSLSKFSNSSNKIFTIGCNFCDSEGNWFTTSVTENYDFGTKGTLKYRNTSASLYCQFFLGSLAPDPSPSYTYTITTSNL